MKLLFFYTQEFTPGSLKCAYIEVGGREEMELAF